MDIEDTLIKQDLTADWAVLQDIFDVHGLSCQLFHQTPLPWQWLSLLEDELNKLSQGGIIISKTARIDATATIIAPAYIGEGCDIGPNALIREGCILTEDCHIGHCVEIKHSILLPGATCGHRNYIGDSVLGRRVNMGDGSGTANMRVDKNPISLFWAGKMLASGLRKVGAFVGDDSSIGCRATLMPGTILGKNCLVHPNIAVKGTHEPGTFIKPAYALEAVKRNDL